MDSQKYLTGKWLNGRMIMVAVSASLLIATVVKIADLVDNGAQIQGRGVNVSMTMSSGFECIVGEDNYTSQARLV